jgi:hypothetical protein
MVKEKYTKENLEKLVLESNTFSELVRKLTGNEKVHGNMVAFVKNKLINYNIDFSHFKGRGWSKGVKNNGFKAITKEDLIKNYLTPNPLKRTCNNNIKNWLFGLELLKRKCDKCGIDDNWNGSKLILQLDHIDGDNTNNELSNLRILCPNCHSQTHNYAGRKNKKEDSIHGDKQT